MGSAEERDADSLTFVSAGRCARPPERIIKPMVHDSWSLALNESKGLRIRFGAWNARWAAHPANVLLLIRPGTTTWTDESRAGRRYRSSYVLFRTVGDDGLERLFKKGETQLFIEDPGGVAVGLIRKMTVLAAAKHAQGHYSEEGELLSQLGAVVRLAIRTSTGRCVLPLENPHRLPDPVVGPLTTWMRENLQKPVTRQDLARQAGKCVSALSQHVSQTTGSTLMGLLRQLRIDEGARLLERGLVVEQAAIGAGFGDASHFSRVFKKQMGCPPGVYARRRRSERKLAPATRQIPLPMKKERRRDEEPMAVPLYFEHAIRDSLDATEEVTPLYWTLDYFFTDGVSVRMGSPRAKPLVCPAGSAHIYPPESHFWEGFKAPASRRSEGAWIFFHPLHMPLRHFIGGTGLIRMQDVSGELGRLMRRMQKVVGRRGFRSDHQSLLAPLLEQALRLLAAASRHDGTYVIGDRPAAAGEGEWVRRVEDILRRHIAGGLNRRAMARELGVSVSLLAHRYRAATGEGPMQTLNRYRLEQARELLGRGASVKEAARECGFVDSHYLARCFRKTEGMTPKAYRALMAGNG